MRDMTKSIILLGCLLLFALACGRRYWQSPEKKAEHFIERITSELELKPEQSKILQQTKTEFLQEHRAFREQRKIESEKLAKEIRKDKVDRRILEGFLGQRQAHRDRMHKLMVNKFLEFHAVLTPEQREKLASKIEEKSGMWRPYH